MIGKKVLFSLYSLATFLLSPLALALLSLSARGRARLQERLGSWDIEKGSYIWFHGASAGEVSGLMPLIKGLATGDPLLVTATSVTGLDMASQVTKHCHLLPLDSWIWYRRIFEKITPRAVVISETELWPALYHELERRNIPLVLVLSLIHI